MAYKRITAAEAAALIQNGQNIGLSGFTPAGTAKAVTHELAKRAEAEHAAGREFKIGLFTGASTGQSADGDLSNAQAIGYRAPYTTNPDFRRHVNAGEIAYNDIHLSQMAQELRYGFMGQVDWAILEVCDIYGRRRHQPYRGTFGKARDTGAQLLPQQGRETAARRVRTARPAPAPAHTHHPR